MATKAQKNKAKSSNNLKSRYGKIHNQVLEVSEEAVEVTVENLERWQNLLGKAIKGTTPIIDKNIDLTFDVIETIAKQYKDGGKRMKSLLGIGGKSYQRTLPTKKASSAIPAKKVSKPVSNIKKKNTPVKNTPSNKGTKNNLTKVTGIGPKIENLLNAEGINTMKDLAEANISALNTVLEKAGPRFQMHDPSTWINQAKTLIKA